MSDLLFGEWAPKYWAGGLPVIPIMKGFKRPAISAWQIYGDRFPTEDEQNSWLASFPNGNIGVTTGPVSGIVAIDVDRDDPALMAIIDRVLPKSPWKRVGKKGCILAYRYTGNRTFRIAGKAPGEDKASMILECLSKGTQFVMPPSIHPDTGREYVANCNLLDVMHALPELPREAESILRGALADAGYIIDAGGSMKLTVMVPAGARDSAMTSHAGILSRAILRGERSLLEALDEMGHWVETYTEQVAGDPLDPVKAKAKVVEFLFKDVTGDKRRTLPSNWDDGLTAEQKKAMGLEFGDDAERWDCTRLFDFLRGELERHQDPNSDGWSAAVDVVLDRIARNPNFSKLDEEKMLKFVVTQSKGTFSLATLRRQLVRLRQGEVAGNDHTEIAKAALKDLAAFGEIRFCRGTLWQWKGACWDRLDEAEVLNHIADEYGSLAAAKKFGDHRAIMQIVRSQATLDLILNRTVGVNFANGFLTEELELKPHHPDYGMTYVLPYRYIADKTNCPLFQQLLADAWGEDPDYQDKVLALQEAMAATLMGLAPRYQRAFCLQGQAGSGKSRIVEIMRGLMPAGASSEISPSDWGDKFLPAQMADKLINFAGEVSESKSIAGDVFKQIVEGQTITGQHKNGQPFAFSSKAAQWFASNHTPKTRDTSDGFNRRWLFLDFPRKVPFEKKQVDIDQIILGWEREQIVAWALQGLARLVANKDYTLPTSHMALVDDMAVSNNSVRYFLSHNSRLRLGRQEHVDRSEIRTTGQRLFEEYWSFCAGAGGVPRVQQPKFHVLMRELQDDFKFRQVRPVTKDGQQQIDYDYITFVERKMAA